jgi:hypothetical protein
MRSTMHPLPSDQGTELANPYSQKMTLASSVGAERKTLAHLSQRVAIRRQSFTLSNMIFIRFRRLYQRLWERTIFPRAF